MGKRVKVKKEVKFFDMVLLFMAMFLLAFVVACLWLFYKTSSEPSTLIVAVSGAFVGEAGFIAMLTKNKQTNATQTVTATKAEEVIDLSERKEPDDAGIT